MTSEVLLNELQKRGAEKSSSKKSASKKGKPKSLTLCPAKTKNIEELVQVEE